MAKGHGSSHGGGHGASHGASSHGASHGAAHGAAHGGGHGDSHGGGASHGAAHGGGGGSHGGGSGGGGGNFILWIIAFIAFCYISDATCTRFKKFVNGESTSSPTSYSQPDVSTKYITLKKGASPIRINIPSGYRCECTGGGKKYYHQEQNGPKNIMGDGKFHPGGEHAAYFDLSYYNQEITVVCEFKKL